MNNTELVTKFAEMIREKNKNRSRAMEYAGAFGHMTGVLDFLVESFPEVRRFIEEQLEREKP